MKFDVRVEVKGLEGIADPEGRTIERALPVMGFDGVFGLEVGRVISFHLEADDEQTARQQVAKMCTDLLANPVIERTVVDFAPSAEALIE